MAQSPPPGTPSEQSPAVLLGRYHVEATLGSGAFGTVVRAYDPTIKRTVAIKTLNPGLSVAYAVDALSNLRERFVREAEAGARMGVHPHIIAVYDLVAAPDGSLYLIQEYAPGGTLAERITGETLPVAAALRLTMEAASGLQAAHEVGIVHRDIKPVNLFLTERGQVKVGDFGIAQIDDLSGRTRATVGHPGTPLYMSPEQAHMTAYVQPTTDQYSLGLVLFEMLTGVAYRRLNARDAQQHLAVFPPPVRMLFERMTAESPDNRYPTMGDVRAAIQAIEAHAPADAAAVAPSEDGRGARVGGPAPPGMAVGSPDAPTYPITGTGGTQHVNQQPAPSAPPAHYAPPPVQPAPPRGKRGLLIGVGGLLLVALIAGGAFLLLGRGGSSTRTSQTATAPTNPGSGTSQPTGVVADVGGGKGATSTAPGQTSGTARSVNATNPPPTGANATPASGGNPAGTIPSDGSPVSVTIATAGQKARLTFAGTSGQVVAVQASKATFAGCGSTIEILKPDDLPLGTPQAICGGGAFLDQQMLPTSGTYTVLLTSDGPTGTASIALYSIVNVTGAIMPDGSPVSVKITTPGQKARYTFTGTSGQIVAVQATKSTFGGCGTTISVLNPDDSALGSPQAICGGGGFLDQQSLPTNGAYTVLVDPDGATTGGAVLALYTVVDVTGTITPGGSPINAKIVTPGQKARYTFAGTDGQIVTVQASKGTFAGCGTTIALLKPDDSPLGSPQAICGGAGFLDQQVLPTNGTYTVLVNPDGPTTGGATLALYTVMDVKGTITAGGPPVSVKITTPGQNARYTFSGTSGQTVTVQVSKATFAGCDTTVVILKPDDSPLGSPQPICSGTGSLDPQTLPTSGTYTVLVNPDGATTGEATVTLSTAATR